jgi:transcriptional regulator
MADTAVLQMLVLAAIEQRARHGYEIAKLIESRSEGKLEFHIASLYPLLYRLENKGLVEGRWVEKANERRRRFYKITAQGRRELARQRQSWREFIRALDQVAQIGNA